MDMPAAHFLFPLGAPFLRFHVFCSFYKARPGANTLPFSFPRVVQSAQVPVLSLDLQSQAGFLCRFRSYLQRLAFITGGDYAGSQSWSAGNVGEVSEVTCGSAV